MTKDETTGEEFFTVRELIEKLQALDPDLNVATEGCDCEGGWNGKVLVREQQYDQRRPKTFVVIGRGSIW